MLVSSGLQSFEVINTHIKEESEDSSTSYIPLLERAGIENLKFSLLNSKGGRGAKAKQFERARLEKEKAERARENKMIESASSLNINIDNKERAQCRPQCLKRGNKYGFFI